MSSAKRFLRRLKKGRTWQEETLVRGLLPVAEEETQCNDCDDDDNGQGWSYDDEIISRSYCCRVADA